MQVNLGLSVEANERRLTTVSLLRTSAIQASLVVLDLASVATATRYDSVACDEGEVHLPKDSTSLTKCKVNFVAIANMCTKNIIFAVGICLGF